MQNEKLNKIIKCMDRIEPFPTKFDDNTLDRETYDWYISRFKMLEEDGCVLAINPYLTKLLRENKTNTYTIVQIQRAAVEIISRS